MGRTTAAATVDVAMMSVVVAVVTVALPVITAVLVFVKVFVTLTVTVVVGAETVMAAAVIPMHEQALEYRTDPEQGVA